MNVFDISFGTNRTDRDTRQVRWDWSQITGRLSDYVRCDHTTKEYAKMSKTQQQAAKDVGFFIGGLAVKRKVVHRQLIVLDIDDATEDTLKVLRAWLKGKSYMIHSTHGSTLSYPRYRVIVPLNRFVLAEEYGAMLRTLNDKFNIPLDPATLDFNRIMFLPSVPHDADFFSEVKKGGDLLDVDALLAESGDWRDLSTLGVPKLVGVQDPKFKGGIVGAFCSKVSIHDAMDIYLTEVWRKEANGRYTYNGASTTSGGIVYEDKFLYSNHSTDPFMGHCHNAYDAVRLYRFGQGKQGDAAMIALCNSLGITVETGQQHALTIDSMEDEDAKAILKNRLAIDKTGKIARNLQSAKLILTYDPKIRDIFAYDLFAETPVLKRQPFWRSLDVQIPNEDCRDVASYTGMADVDESYLKLYFEEKYEFNSEPFLKDALNMVEHENAFHPVREYLSSLKWDGVKRLETIFIDCFGVRDTLYSREVGKKFFTAAVRRVFMPSSKMDYVPVLVSEEGLGKSKFIKRMGKLWGSDTFYTFTGSKEAYEQLRGVWIVEIPELNGVQSRNTNSKKAFITKGTDRYRSAYLKYIKNYDRQCVFIASSNDVIFLDDPSEMGRRWWGMTCDKSRITVDIFADSFLDRVNDYWAEAVQYYLDGVLPVLSPEAEKQANQIRKIHKTESLEQGSLIDYLNMPVPKDWYKMTFFEHKQYWEYEKEHWRGYPRNKICNAEVAREFYGYDRRDMDVKATRRVSEAIRATNLFIQDGDEESFGIYGRARAWTRLERIVDLD